MQFKPILSDEEIYTPPFVVNEVNPFLPLSQSVDWGPQLLRIQEIHKLGITGRGVKVAVLDTGVQPDHPDLNGQVIKTINTYTSEPYASTNGHGTAVASVIAAKDNSTGILGYAPDAQIVAIKVLRESGSGSYDNIIRGVRIAIEEGVDIINMSLGGGSDHPSLKKAIQDAVKKGIIVVCAAGNNGKDNSVSYPGRYEEVVCVGAINKQVKTSSFSSRGWELDVAAPGEQVLCAYKNNGYARISGTSFACPAVAGCAALFLEAGTKLTHQLLKDTSIDIEDEGLDPKTGHGLINPYEIVKEEPQPSVTPSYTPDPTPEPTPDPTPDPTPSPTKEPQGCLGLGKVKEAYDLLGKFLKENEK